jgi:hypothetical protein
MMEENFYLKEKELPENFIIPLFNPSIFMFSQKLVNFSFSINELKIVCQVLAMNQALCKEIEWRKYA